MAEWLILQLPRGLDDQCGWMLADDSGAARSAPQIGTLAQAAGESAGRRVAAVVPSSDVLITEVELPQKAGVRAPQVVAYALEEQVAADIETLHFALGERDDATGRSAVAVVTRTLMNEWLAVLLAAGLAPVALCAEAALLPENPGHTVLLIDGDTLSLRRAGRAPLSLPAADLSAAIEASLGAEMATENIILYATARDWTRHAAEGELLRARCASLKVQLLESGALPLLAPQLASGRYINLLAGEWTAI